MWGGTFLAHLCFRALATNPLGEQTHVGGVLLLVLYSSSSRSRSVVSVVAVAAALAM